MEFLFVTKYFSFQRSVLLLRFTILIAQLEISYGSLQAGEFSELNGTATHQRNATINTLSTTTTALVRSTDKHAFGPETENSTVTERSEHINDWEQLINNNETRVLNFYSASDNMISITNQTFNEPVGNTTESSLNDTSSSDTLFHNAVSVTFVSIGFTVSFLNISVIIVTFSTRKLRQNTYPNLILTLSVSDFIFGLTTLLTGIRRLSNLLSKIKELCILSNLIVPTCFLVSLYQMFLISLHRYLVISGSGAKSCSNKNASTSGIWLAGLCRLFRCHSLFLRFPLKLIIHVQLTLYSMKIVHRILHNGYTRGRVHLLDPRILLFGHV